MGGRAGGSLWGGVAVGRACCEFCAAAGLPCDALPHRGMLPALTCCCHACAALQGAPYGYTPFCDTNTDMDGFRFWKQVGALGLVNSAASEK